VNNGTTAVASKGQINFASTTGVTVNGTTTNAPTITAGIVNVSDAGIITFADGPHVLKGLVTNQPTFSGAAGATVTVSYTDNGQIRFATTTSNLTLKAGLAVSATNNMTDGWTSGAATTITATGNGTVRFALTSGNYLSDGGISNSSVFNATTKATGRVAGGVSMTNNAWVWFPTQTTGTIGIVATPIGAISNTSVSKFADDNGSILFSGFGGGIYAGAMSTSGADGGRIGIGDCSVTLASISNSRTVAADHISIGNGPTALVEVAITGDVTNSGASNILFNSYNGAGAETFGIGGTLTNSGTGSVKADGAAVLTGAPAISIGGINLSNGTIDFVGAGAATKNIVVNGTAVFTGGVLKLQTSATRTLQLGGLANTFGTATANTDFSTAGMNNVTLLVSATAVAGVQTVTGAPTATAWYGPVSLSNTNGAAADPGIILTGGNFRVLNNVTFAGTKPVRIDNVTLFIGGLNAPVAGTGNFVNTSGYSITGNGFVSMNGNAPQTVSGAGVFANFEADNANGVAVAGTFKNQFNLTNGAVSGGAAIIFDNGVVYPTIVRNAGTFTVVPTFTSMVNVYYIGLDKASALELPTTAGKLNNLTVATTNGGVAGKGRVEFNNLTPDVNGTINVFPGQAIYLSGTTVLTMNGPAITLDGDIANQTVANTLVLNRVAGTTITGAGVLPEISVAAKSQNNAINGATGLATGLLGANGVRGTDDVDPGATGSIFYVANAGTDTSSLTVAFGTANTVTKTHLLNVSTNTGAQFYLGANLMQKGNLTHNAGIVDVMTYTYNHAGVAPMVTGNVLGGAVTRGAGRLYFTGGPTLLSVATATDTIATNVEINLAAAGDAFTISPASIGGLQIAGDFTLTRGTLVLGDLFAARDLELTGKTFTIAADGSISTLGVGTLKLNAAVPPMTMTYTGTPLMNNVTVSNSVTMAGTGTQLTVQGSLIHDAGVLDFGTRTLVSSGTYARTTGTYAATSGYFVFSGTAFNNGTVGDTIPNFRLANAGAVTWGGVGANPWAYAPLFVSKTLDVNHVGTLTHKGKLTVADKATVNFFRSVTMDTVIVYGGTITLNLVNVVNASIPATLWPELPTSLVTTLNVNTDPAVMAYLPIAVAPTSISAIPIMTPTIRWVNKNFVLTSGAFYLSGNTLQYADSILVTAKGGNLDLPILFASPAAKKTSAIGPVTGTVAYGKGIDVVYAGTAPTGVELPNVVKNLKFTRSSNTGNFMTAISKAVTVEGKLEIFNNVSDVNALTVLGDVTIASEAAAFSNATTPVTSFGGDLSFAGAVNQTLTYPALGLGIGGNLTINKTSNVNKVSLVGGDLSVSGKVNFVNGLLYTGATNALVLNNPVGFNAGFTHVVAAGSRSHVIGNVRQTLKLGSIISAGRTEFPVGDTAFYRPTTLTFVNDQLGNQTLGIEATVKYNAIAPTGIVGLPITNGVNAGVDLARYAPFSWSINTTGSLGQTKFNLELTAEGFGEFNSTDNLVEDARIVRRAGGVADVANTWFLQGTQYDNFIIGGVPTVTNTQSVGGLLPGGAIFTYGLKSTLQIANKIEDVSIKVNGAGYTRRLTNPPVFGGNRGTLTYAVTSSNGAIATAVIKGDSVVVTPKALGTTVITVTATDIDGAKIANAFNVKVTGTASVLLATKALDFGKVLVNQKRTLPLIITNNGTDTLKVTNVASPNSIFKASSVAFSLAPGASITDSITATAPASANVVADKLIIVSNSLTGADTVSLTMNAVLTDVEVITAIPTEFSLGQNYPNPFNPSTTITFALPKAAPVTIEVYNILGAKVRTLFNNQVMNAAFHNVVWDGKDDNGTQMSSGMYLYRINADKFTASKKMMMLK